MEYEDSEIWVNHIKLIKLTYSLFSTKFSLCASLDCVSLLSWGGSIVTRSKLLLNDLKIVIYGYIFFWEGGCLIPASNPFYSTVPQSLKKFLGCCKSSCSQKALAELPPKPVRHLLQAVKDHSTDESTLQQIYTLGFLGALTAQYLNHLRASPANDANISLSHIFLPPRYDASPREETQQEHGPGLPVESGEIKISKCSLRKWANPLQRGSIQEAVGVGRRWLR